MELENVEAKVGMIRQRLLRGIVDFFGTSRCRDNLRTVFFKRLWRFNRFNAVVTESD